MRARAPGRSGLGLMSVRALRIRVVAPQSLQPARCFLQVHAGLMCTCAHCSGVSPREEVRSWRRSHALPTTDPLNPNFGEDKSEWRWVGQRGWLETRRIVDEGHRHNQEDEKKDFGYMFDRKSLVNFFCVSVGRAVA